MYKDWWKQWGKWYVSVGFSANHPKHGFSFQTHFDLSRYDGGDGNGVWYEFCCGVALLFVSVSLSVGRDREIIDVSFLDKFDRDSDLPEV